MDRRIGAGFGALPPDLQSLTQGEKFDPGGHYIRTYVPELSSLPDHFIHKPWEAPPQILQAAGIELGTTYSTPIVPHGPARERALQAFRSLRELPFVEP